jgi:hypothetical protein
LPAAVGGLPAMLGGDAQSPQWCAAVALEDHFGLNEDIVHGAGLILRQASESKTLNIVDQADENTFVRWRNIAE